MSMVVVVLGVSYSTRPSIRVVLPVVYLSNSMLDDCWTWRQQQQGAMQELGAMQGRRPQDLARGGGLFRAGLACPIGLLAGEVDADDAAVRAKRRARGRALLRGYSGPDDIMARAPGPPEFAPPVVAWGGTA